MPLYEYRCDACGGKEEKLQSLSAPTDHDCSHCGATHGMKRQLSVSAFSLSGGGWFSEGYGKEAACAAPSATPAPSGGCTGCPCAGSH